MTDSPTGKQRNWIMLAGFVLACEAVGAISGWLTAPEIAGWYATLTKPSFNPPNWVFAPVWTALFCTNGDCGLVGVAHADVCAALGVPALFLASTLRQLSLVDDVLSSTFNIEGGCGDSVSARLHCGDRLLLRVDEPCGGVTDGAVCLLGGVCSGVELGAVAAEQIGTNSSPLRFYKRCRHTPVEVKGNHH